MASPPIGLETHSGDQSDDEPSTSLRKKVRTGCGTCKMRKVKCDEAKPFCRRCVSTGRTCEGYREPPPPKERVRRSKYTIDAEDDATRRPRLLASLAQDSAQVLVAARTTPSWSPPPITTVTYDLVGDPDEQRSFYYFRHQAVHNISGYFELAFWNCHVLQASYTEPCVRHALLALSSLHESYEIAYLEAHPSARERAGSLRTLALTQYSRAISILASDISTERPSLQVILISCLIFIWIEFVQDNIDTAVKHLQSGLQLLDQSKDNLVDESVTRLFTRLQTQVTVHGNAGFDRDVFNGPLSPIVSSPQPPVFRDVFDARYALDGEFAKIFRFHRQCENPRFIEYQITHHPYPDQLSLHAICQGHLHNLQQWKVAFQQTRARSPSLETDEKQLIALAQLELQYLFVANTLQTLFTTTQMIYDQFAADFQRMLSLAETLVMRSKEKFYVFAFDTGALSSLFYVVLKCRDPAVRQRAVGLLKQAPPREGMWDRQSVIEVAEWKIRKEEQGRTELSPTSPLPNNARIYCESGREETIDGRNMTVLRYKRGAEDPGGEDTFEEEITTVGTRLARVLGSPS